MAQARGDLPAPVQRALERAASDAAVSPGQVRLIDYEPVEWPDTALGVPKPGRLYPQVITPGYRVRLRLDAAGAEVEYHTDQGSRIVRLP